MKLIDQYLYLVGKSLPLRGKKDLLKELETLILDDIEERFGPSPKEADILYALKQFGSPKEVAARYTGEKPLFAPAVEQLYRFILAVMIAGIAIGFSVNAIVALARQPDSLEVTDLAGFLFGMINAIIAGTGTVTLLAIGASRIPAIAALQAEKDDWIAEEVKGVELDEHIPSRIESLITVAFTAVLVVLANRMPWVVSLAEEKIGYTGLVLSHTVSIARLVPYIRMASVFWILEALQHVAFYIRHKRTALETGIDIVIKAASAVLAIVMFFDTGLYLDYAGIMGFRLLMLISAVASLVSLVFYVKKMIEKKIG